MIENIKSTIRNIILFVVLIAITFFIIFKNYDIKQTIDMIGNANGLYVILAIISMSLYFLFESINNKCILNNLNRKISIFKALKFSIIGFFFSGITPASGGGQPMEVYYMSKDGIPSSYGTLSLLVQMIAFHTVTVLFAIIGAIISSIHFLRKKFKECPTTDLFDQLTSKELSDVTRRKILQKLNKSSLISNRIKEEYIQTFALEKRGRETVLFDICDSNDIEPTDDVCKGLIGAFMPSLRKRYQEKRQNQKELLSEAPVSIMDLMENDKTPNHHGEQTVYMSELLKTKYPETCERLIKILDKYNVKYSFLKGTKDIWCRDYMPIQTESGKFILFNYDPSYLKGNKEWEESRSDVKEVCRINNVNAQFSNIIIDGGNVLICDGRGILSDRIFSENPNWGREELVSELSKLLECEIIIIPAQKGDMTGHADGMVRFVNKNTILGNSLDAEYKYWREGMLKVIEQ